MEPISGLAMAAAVQIKISWASLEQHRSLAAAWAKSEATTTRSGMLRFVMHNVPEWMQYIFVDCPLLIPVC